MTEVMANQRLPGGVELLFAQSVPDDVQALNATIIARLAQAPNIWNYPLSDIRKARAQGRGSFPLRPVDPAATVRIIPARNGAVRVRELLPAGGSVRGTYIHIHGGGWVMGTPEENDWHLRRIADATGLRTVSIDYRLAPEDPWPACADDCEDAAMALLTETADPQHAWLIGGESAGAHLSAVTMIRLRDRHGLTPFRAANLIAGCFDLALTPSVRQWGDVKLVLRTQDVVNFVDRLLPERLLAETPDVSPLRAHLHGLPPALFSCGMQDLLLDDSMMMAGRWLAAGNAARLSLWPGGCHVFQHFETGQAKQSLVEIERFLAAYAG
jgi:acetyl esterase